MTRWVWELTRSFQYKRQHQQTKTLFFRALKPFVVSVHINAKTLQHPIRLSCSGVPGTGNVSDFVFSAASLSQVSLIHLLECKPKNNSCVSPPPAASCFLSNSSSPWFISPPALLFNLRLDHRPSAAVLLFTKPPPPHPSPTQYLSKTSNYASARLFCDN